MKATQQMKRNGINHREHIYRKDKDVNSMCSLCSLWLIFCLFHGLSGVSAVGQIQQAWVSRYNNGIANGTHQALKMALDPAGNIYVTGFSQNTNSQLGYATIKYAPNGNQVWASRYDSTNYPTATPAGFVLDGSNNVVVTGSALTVKYDSNGNQLWTAPYSGTSLAVDTNGNVGITGFGTTLDTVKVSPSGSNLWLQTFPGSCAAAVGQTVTADTVGDFYVTGSYPFFCETEYGITYVYGIYLLIIKYAADGSQMWTSTNLDGASVPNVQCAAIDSIGNFYVNVNFDPNVNYNTLFKYGPTGSLVWTAYDPGPDPIADVSHGLVLDKIGNVFETGQSVYIAPHYAYAMAEYGTYKANTNGVWVWEDYYASIAVHPGIVSIANAIALDQSDNVYVTGYAVETNSGNAIVTIKYDPNGNQIWLQRYNAPGNGNAVGNAIAVDDNGNVYVTSYETTAAGGTEFVTIKYSPVTLQRRSDGTMLLQAQGSPGESFDVQASANLQTWLDLGCVTANSNGLMQFTDTNAPNYNARFYVTSPQ